MSNSNNKHNTARWKRIFSRKPAIEQIEPVLTDETRQVLESVDKLTGAPKEMVVADVRPVHPELTQPVRLVETAKAPETKQGFINRVLLKLKRQQVDELEPLPLDKLRLNPPIRLLIGFIPDVSERDARFFANGVASKNVESEYITYLGLQKYKSGYAYEIQEGGHGRSYLEPLIQYYEGLPQTAFDQQSAVYLATAQRMVLVEKTADGGLVSVQLPQAYRATATEWLVPTKKLKLLRDLNTGYMMAAGTFLGVSLIALIGAFATRYQPYEAPPPAEHDKVSIESLPSRHFTDLKNVPPGHYVRAWKYSKGKWLTPEFAPVPVDPLDDKTGMALPPAPGAPELSANGQRGVTKVKTLEKTSPAEDASTDTKRPRKARAASKAR